MGRHPIRTVRDHASMLILLTYLEILENSGGDATTYVDWPFSHVDIIWQNCRIKLYVQSYQNTYAASKWMSFNIINFLTWKLGHG